MSITVRPWTLAFAALSLFASAAFATAPDLAVTKVGPASANAGTDVTYTIQVTNSGTSATPAVELTDPFPAGTSFVSVTPAAGFTCTTSGSLICDSSSIAGTSTATFVLVLHIDSSTPAGTISNTATAVMATDDPTPTDDTSTADTTVATSADLAVTKVGPANVQSGSDATYTITLTNNGPSDAASVMLTDATPPNTTFVSEGQASGPTFICSQPSAGGTGTVSCSLASMPASTSAVFTIVLHITGASGSTLSNTAKASTTTTDPDLSNNQGTAASTVVAPDLAVTKVGPANAVAGTNVTYTVTLANNGSASAASVSLTDSVPADMTFVSESQSSGPAFSCSNPSSGGTGTTTCNIATLAASQSAIFVFVFNVNTSSPDGITIGNTATAATTSPESSTSNNTSTANTTINNSADLAVSKIGPMNAVAGTNVTYTVTVSNGGPVAAQNVVLNDPTPANTTFVSEMQTSGPAFVCSGSVSCTLASFASGASATFVIVFNASASSSSPTITNTATVSSSTADRTPGNNSASFQTTLSGINADLAITKTGPSGAVTPNATITYTIAVTNDGPGLASGVTVTDTLPPAETFVSATPSQGTCSGTTTVTCSLGTLANGSTATITLVARIGSASGPISNTATVSSSSVDTNLANNTASATVTVTTVNIPAESRPMMLLLVALLAISGMMIVRR